MCGRYTHLLTWSQIVELYRLTLPDEPKDLRPSYNVAPTHVMPIRRRSKGSPNSAEGKGAWPAQCPSDFILAFSLGLKPNKLVAIRIGC